MIYEEDPMGENNRLYYYYDEIKAEKRSSYWQGFAVGLLTGAITCFLFFWLMAELIGV